MRNKTLTLTATFLLLAQFGFGQSPVSVFVMAQRQTDGFVDSGRSADSVKDLRDNIQKRKTMRLAERLEESDLVIEVVQSGMFNVGTETNTTVRPGIIRGADVNSTTSSKELPGIAIKMSVRGSDYSKEFQFVQQMFWKDLAKYLMNNVEDWIKSNRAQLEAIKSKH